MNIDMSKESNRKALSEALDTMQLPSASGAAPNKRKKDNEDDDPDPEKQAKKQERNNNSCLF